MGCPKTGPIQAPTVSVRRRSPRRRRLRIIQGSMSLTMSFIPAILLAAAPVGGEAVSPSDALARGLLKELVETNTTHSVGDTTKAAAAMAGRLRGAGFAEADLRVLGPHPAR